MKVYIAAKWQLRDEVNRLYEIFEKAGHTITEKWTEHKAVKPYNEDKTLSGKNSQKNMEGVIHSEVFVLLSDPKEGIGKSSEFGAALASYIQKKSPMVYVFGEKNNQSEHYFNPNIRRVSSIDTILKDMEKM